jgi:hypothetical protein
MNNEIYKHAKAVISNKLVEVILQSQQISVGRSSSGGRKSYSIQNIENHATNLKVSINRARNQIRRLLECNFTDDKYVFLTLTFKPNKEVDITDIKSCNKLFAKFKKRLAYYLTKNNLPEIKYLGVIEFQDGNRLGAIHYHIICNLVEIPVEKLKELWQYGFVHKAIIKSNATRNEKITYYLNKGMADPRLNGHKRYFHSHSLKQPITVDVKDQEEFYSKLNKCNPTLKNGSTFQIPFLGEAKYEKYYVKNIKELIEYAQEL